MLMGELLTAAGLDIPVKLMIFNNSTLGMVRAEMMVVGYQPWGTDPRALAVPPHTTLEEIRGFALATGKLVFSGDSAEVWGQAESNIRDVRQSL
jgi:Thiamine pyrophosphate enzyme, C-terminal TPP binding domain